MPEIKPYKPLPKQFCNYQRLLDTLEAREIDGVVVQYTQNVFYLSGYMGVSATPEPDSASAVVISRHQPDHPILITLQLKLPQFLYQPTWIEDIRTFPGVLTQHDLPAESRFDGWWIPSSYRAVPWVATAREHRVSSLTSGVNRALEDLNLKSARVGFDHLAFARRFASAELEPVDAYNALKFARSVKTDDEVTLLRTAAAVNQAAITATVDSWTRGMTLWDLIHVYRREAVSFGGTLRDTVPFFAMNLQDGDPTPPFVSMTGLEQDYVVEEGSIIMFDCHGTFNSYCWDGGKSWFVGDEPTHKAKQVATGCGVALEAVQEAMRPGVRISELQRIGRRTLRQCGLRRSDDALIFFHGVGLSHNEFETPDGTERALQAALDWKLEDKMVVAPHIAYPGDKTDRYYIEDATVVLRHGGEPCFTWGVEPLVGGGPD